MVFKFRPQFTIYHPEQDKLLFWSNVVTVSPPGESIVFMWGDKLPVGLRHMLITMHHIHDIETDQSRLNFLIRDMLKFLKDTSVWEEIMLVPIDRDTGTSGKDKTIIDDLNFIKAIRGRGLDG
jgi:hypothetical protein